MQTDNHLTFIVYIHYRTWFRYTRRPHYSELSNFGTLYIIESPLVLFSKEFLKNIFSNIKHYLEYSTGLRFDERSNANVYRPVLLFSANLKNKISLLKKIDLKLLELQTRSFYKHASVKINFITNLFNEWVIRNKERNYWVLDINDDWSMMSYNESKRIPVENRIKEVINKVDLALTVTRKLCIKYSINGKTTFLPNAVDINHYVPEFEQKSSKIKEKKINDLFNIKFLEKEENDQRLYTTNLALLNNLSKPIIGSYSGLSGNWSDFAFISKVEKLLPLEYNMVSSGIIHPPTKQQYINEYIEYLENQRMIYLGYVDYSVLPEFLEKLNVGIVMHRMDEFNTHSAPNKIWAYLAMGLPVVSTDFLTESDKDIYEDLVKFAKTPEQYVQYIMDEYHSDNITKKKMRRELAERYSTKNRADKLVKILVEKLECISDNLKVKS